MRLPGGRRGIGGAVALGVVMSCLSASPGAAVAKTFVVTRAGDPVPDACRRADCSLREAIRAANAKSGADTILLPSRKGYRLSQGSTGEDAAFDGDLDIAGGPLRLVHRGEGRATIDAQGIDRVFEIFAGAPTVLKGLRITGGDEPSSDEGNGGGIRTEAGLRLIDSAVSGNHAIGADGSGGGIEASGGKLTIIGSAVSHNEADDSSGAIDVDNHGLIVRRSSLVGNLATFAGVSYMYGDGASQIVNSTIAGNRSTGEAGGIYFSEAVGATLKIFRSTISGNVAAGDSGGISARNGDLLSLTNSTVTGNRAGGYGGGIWALSPLSLNAVTVARNVADADQAGGENGAGIYRIPLGPPDEVENSLIALNHLGDGTPNDCGGDPFASLGHNLLSTTGPTTACSGFDQDGDLVNPSPGLGKLHRNGGPTKTIALLKGSPAINQADRDTSPTRDQRGVKRRNPDIGAFERR